ncbi:hypothetical protein [Staphylococcus equorum]|uniref:hypothetical protein n=1 Tax=Staphylococcus equorum TaxID=246432 RepID=UPI003FD7BC16
MIRTVKDYEKLSEQYNKMIAERNSLIDDLSWYKAKVSRLERENRFLLSRKDNLFDSWRDENKRSVALSKKIEQLERENERLRVKSDSFFERWKFKSAMYTDLSKESDKYKSLLTEFSQHIGNKPSSSTYKYFRAKLNALKIREDE